MIGCVYIKIYVYLDESGSIHKNSSTKYFKVRFWLSIEKRINN